MNKRKSWAALAVPLTVLALGIGAVPANAASGGSGGVGSGPTGGDDYGYVVVDPSQAEATSNGTFYPTGAVDADTLVVIPNADGSLPAGVTQAKLDAIHSQLNTAAGVKAAEQLGYTVAGPGAAKSSGASTNAVASPSATQASHAYSASSAGFSRAFAGPNIIGTTATTTVNYNFSIGQGFDQFVAGQGLGYYRGYNGSEFGTFSKYYTLNSATPTTAGGGTVSWGNVAAQTQFKARCAKSTICGGTFNVNGQ